MITVIVKSKHSNLPHVFRHIGEAELCGNLTVSRKKQIKVARSELHPYPDFDFETSGNKDRYFIDLFVYFLYFFGSSERCSGVIRMKKRGGEGTNQNIFHLDKQKECTFQTSANSRRGIKPLMYLL